MTITDDLRNLLIRHEGLKLRPYKCPAGRDTIGYGHNMEAKPLPDHMRDYLAEHGEITRDMAEDLLADDIAGAIRDCRSLYHRFDTFGDRRKWALIDFLFNVGLRTARTFANTNRAINRGDWEAAAQGFEKSLWYRQVNHRAVEIVSMIREG